MLSPYMQLRRLRAGNALLTLLASRELHGFDLFRYGGEVDPSTQGHEGAGNFSNEVFCFDTVSPQPVCKMCICWYASLGYS